MRLTPIECKNKNVGVWGVLAAPVYKKKSLEFKCVHLVELLAQLLPFIGSRKLVMLKYSGRVLTVRTV